MQLSHFWRLLVPLFVAGPACIAPVPQAEVMCETNSECDISRGEACFENICYGDPPQDSSFAAILSPPDDRSDLTTTELTNLTFSPDGISDSLQFAPSILVSGIVFVACSSKLQVGCGPSSPIAASITVERISQIPGGPPYKRSVTTLNNDSGMQGFSFRLPKNDEAIYTVTVVPLATDETTPKVTLPPPRQLTIAADKDTEVAWALGEPTDYKIMRSCIASGTNPLSGMEVVAYGQWSEFTAVERASSPTKTDQFGCFEVTVPVGMLDQFELRFEPINRVFPSVRAIGQYARDPLEGENLPAVRTLQPIAVTPGIVKPREIELIVRGSVDNLSIPSAALHLRSVFQQASAENGFVEISHTVVTQTDLQTGATTATLFAPKTKKYVYATTVTAPINSTYASSSELLVEIPAAAGENKRELLLSKRWQANGSVVSSQGEPMIAANLTPKLAQGAAGFVEALPTASTDEDGGFTLLIDPVAEGAAYDVTVTPSDISAPNWTFPALLTADSDLDLGQLRLPEASYVRGLVRDEKGSIVPGTQVSIFRLANPEQCASDTEPCSTDATLLGSWHADSDGWVRPILANPYKH